MIWTLLVLSFWLESPTKTLSIQRFTDASNQKIFRRQRGEESALVQGLMESMAVKLAWHFTVVERAKVDTIFEEQNLVTEGKIATHQPKTGAMTGADYLLTGTITKFFRNEIQFEGYGLTTKRVVFTMGLVYKLLDNSTGEMVHGHDVEVSEEYNGMMGQVDHFHAAKQLADKMASKVDTQIAMYLKDMEDVATTEKTFTLTVESIPHGSDVDLDGFYRGATPLVLTVPRGLYTIDVSKPGYEPWSKKLNVVGDMTIKPTLLRRASN